MREEKPTRPSSEARLLQTSASALRRLARSTIASRWAVGLAIAGVFIVALLLGTWQMNRAKEKQLWQQAHSAGQEATEWTPKGVERPQGKVRIVGRFLPAYSVFLDNRTHKGVAGFYMLTPFRASGGERSVLVLRGWLPQDPRHRHRLPFVETPSGEVKIEGWAELDVANSVQLAAFSPPQGRIFTQVSRSQFAKWSGLALEPWILRQTTQTTPVSPIFVETTFPVLALERSAALSKDPAWARCSTFEIAFDDVQWGEALNASIAPQMLSAAKQCVSQQKLRLPTDFCGSAVINAPRPAGVAVAGQPLLGTGATGAAQSRLAFAALAADSPRRLCDDKLVREWHFSETLHSERHIAYAMQWYGLALVSFVFGFRWAVGLCRASWRKTRCQVDGKA